jgi:hypothetical protein
LGCRREAARVLRAFGRFRLKLIEEGATVRYLRYAAGEILLVVIGILIALQIDSWNDDRLDRLREREYMASMRVDLASDLRAMNRAIEGNKVLLGHLAHLLDLLGDPVDDPAWQRAFFIHSVAYTYWYLNVEFSDLTLSQLRYSGDMALIRDGQVRDAMLNYQTGMEACQRMYSELAGYFHVHEARQKELIDLTLARRMLQRFEADYMDILLPPGSFEADVPEGRYLLDERPETRAAYFGDVAFYRTAMNNAVGFLEEQKRMAEALDRQIVERYSISATE